jgi:hypothetical protein
MSFRLDEQIAAAFKSLFGIAHTGMSNRDWYAELFGRKPPLYGNQVRLEFDYGLNYYAHRDGNVTLDGDIRQTRTWNGTSWTTVASGDAIPVEKIIMPLALCNATNNQAHVALNTPIGVVDPPNVHPTDRMMDFIKFVDFGADFMPRMFWDNGSGTGPGTEITTVALPNDWVWDDDTGLLLCGANNSDQFVPAGNLPIWVQHYRYIGLKGVDNDALPGYRQAVACLAADEVGKLMSIRDDRVNGKWRVQTSDPHVFSKMPAMGVLISKSTPTVGIMQMNGPCDIFTGLNYMRSAYFVGINGNIATGPPAVGGGGFSFVQSIGKPVASDILWLSGNLHIIKRRS